ncbi:mitotic spindle assembly checkpoint protein MAD1 isoform X5 [Fukomys damarensis]|nr:mitotic spindle assembly checkpoint protein MAD1 isoform X5 [Fukomys damarensis]
MRAILGSYDSELTQAEYSPQLTRRMREAEDMVQKVHAHSSEMEAQLSQALEELGVQKQRADMTTDLGQIPLPKSQPSAATETDSPLHVHKHSPLRDTLLPGLQAPLGPWLPALFPVCLIRLEQALLLEMELKILKSQPNSAEPSFPFCREEVDTLRLKVEELEGERSRLEQEKNMLEMQLERRTLQGDYDQSRTKVLHMSLNPTSLAKQRLREERDRLQEECERLRGLVRALERGGPVPTELEATTGLPSTKEVSELRKQVESAELKNQRLKEVFQTKIQEFRKVCYTLTGYQIDITTESQYRLTSQYAEHKTDCLIFKAMGPSGSKMQLLETEFSRSVPELIELHLLRQDSIPAFLSALTLELFSHQTTA